MREVFLYVIHELADWIVRLFVANILWILLNIPIVFVAFHRWFVPLDFGVIYYLLPLFIFLPTLFFPSTIALFSTVRDWVLKRSQRGVFRTYFCHFKRNYKKGSQSGLIFTIFWFIWYGDYFYFKSIQHDMLVMMFIGIGIVLVVYTFQYINLFVHYELRLRELLKSALIVTFGRPLSSLLILISVGIMGFLSVTKLWFLLPSLGGVLLAYASFYLFMKFSRM